MGASNIVYPNKQDLSFTYYYNDLISSLTNHACPPLYTGFSYDGNDRLSTLDTRKSR